MVQNAFIVVLKPPLFVEDCGFTHRLVKQFQPFLFADRYSYPYPFISAHASWRNLERMNILSERDLLSQLLIGVQPPRETWTLLDNPRLGYLSAPVEKHVVKGCPILS